MLPRALLLLLIPVCIFLYSCKKWENPFTVDTRVLFNIETCEIWSPTSDLLSICHVNDKYLFHLGYTDRKPAQASPNGKIAFYTYLDTLRSVSLVNAQKKTYPVFNIDKFTINRDGSKILFVKNKMDLNILDVSSGDTTHLYSTTPIGLIASYIQGIAFANNSNRLLFVIWDADAVGYKIITMDADGSNIIISVAYQNVSKKIEYPAFSSSDAFIYYLMNSVIYSIPATGGTPSRIDWKNAKSENKMPTGLHSACFVPHVNKIFLFYRGANIGALLVDPTSTGYNADICYIFDQSNECKISSNGKLGVCTHEFGSDRKKKTDTKNLWVFPFSDEDDHTYRLLVSGQNCTNISFVPDNF
ncbi:MAG: hypothetical protein A2275_02335 [Bacteroidetes bacterium RIFOXYA12_FULL_35_11]|nr:MAG: hypothetical protein A2X01_03805 [Bacteroidetes bacterium GWF2_35_48]OFY75253.1 MAG: hypothetical protein A2275_02335 [Bacteroidetes bacterium RIFOXYA12_FULL_35_11]OFY96924.1 MAG: hypothetical protein A2309_07315 [Bacteroidetes bacterium RIFOXYB2_FULL_35_7]OFY97724.1 MAG: hypothetical protein A2491_20855 [Bacteroidetes bacterium RIFOXYC12_FULL_35_7]HBX51003.1 hypothetical protein [Bacteroidales bacterium]